MKQKRITKFELAAFLHNSLYNASEDFEDFKRVAAPAKPFIDNVGWERLIHQIPQEELEVFVCLYVGMKPKEIVKTLELNSISKFYNLCASLKKIYAEENWLVLEYN